MKLLKVLCVEDNQDDFELIKLLLQDVARAIGEACFVERARSVSLARSCADVGEYDLFIVDQRLEGVDLGTDFIEHLQEQLPAAPVILVTGREDIDEHSETVRDLQTHKFMFLRKDKLNVESLQACIQQLGVVSFGSTS